jgi:tetratricopeptide (TPR) repeat protein
MWWLLTSAAWAVLPLPEYDTALAEAEWHVLNGVIDQTCTFNPYANAVVCGRPELLDDVIERAEAWMAQVQPDPGLTYLVGLAWRYKGDSDKARRAWESAIAQDPDYRAPWYDLGELLMASDELDQAAKAFAEVTRLTTDTTQAWIGPWRQAEVAAMQQDPAAFEAFMREALRHGFSFKHVASLPNWQGFVADPVMRPSVEKLISVYGTRDVLNSLRAPTLLEP